MTHNRLAESHADRIQSDEAGLRFTVDHLKIRTIDPPVLVNGALVPLSELDAEYAAWRAAYLESRAGELHLHVQPPAQE